MKKYHLSCFFLILLLASANSVAAIIINHLEGFDDTTIVNPIGGNGGTTLGEQRILAFNRVALIWQSYLQIDVDLYVDAKFLPLDCDANSAVLGQGGPTSVDSDFVNAPKQGVWYPAALVDQLKGEGRTEAVIDLTFNSQINGGSTCLGGQDWYYGFDANQTRNEFNFVAILMHEMAHGLGFLSFFDQQTGAFFGGSNAQPDIYSTFLLDLSTGKRWGQMSTDQERKASSTNDLNLVWDGSLVDKFKGALVRGLSQGQVRMYAPTVFEPGSSIAHFDTSLRFVDVLASNELMEPKSSAGVSDFMTSALLGDIGWQVIRDFDGDGLLDPDDDNPLLADVNVDTDNDGIVNSVDEDDDNDGMPDLFELENALNPLDPSDALQDADNDGVTNVDEFLAGSNPRDIMPVVIPDQLPKIRSGAGAMNCILLLILFFWFRFCGYLNINKYS